MLGEPVTGCHLRVSGEQGKPERQREEGDSTNRLLWQEEQQCEEWGALGSSFNYYAISIRPGFALMLKRRVEGEKGGEN